MKKYILSCLILFISSQALAADNKAPQPDTKTVNAIPCQELLAPFSKHAKVKISDEVERAAESFRAYFEAVGEKVLERKNLIYLVSVALLAKEHVLIMGPPGNAKSLLSDEVLGNITDASGKNSYYRIQVTPETTMSETHGPINPKAILESGKINRQYSEGILDKRNAFIDEIFDGRANALRNILGVLAERQHAQGGHIEDGKTETVIAATNKYIDEVYEKAGNDGPKAVLDRFVFNAYVAGELEFTSSYAALISSANVQTKKLPPLSFDELDLLRGLVTQIEIPRPVAETLALISFKMKSESEAMEEASIKTYKNKLRNGEDPTPPYRSTKYHSPRTLYKAASILKAMVVHDYIMNGGKRSLVANFNDLKNLRGFFTLNGPSDDFVKDLLDRTSSPYERSQLSAIIAEREMYDNIYSEIYDEINSFVYRHTLADLMKVDFSDFSRKSKREKKSIYNKIVKHMSEAKLQLDVIEFSGKQSAFSADDIGLRAVYEALDQMLERNFADQYKSTHSKIDNTTTEIISEFKDEESEKNQTLNELKKQHTMLLNKIENYKNTKQELILSKLKFNEIGEGSDDQSRFSNNGTKINLIKDISKGSISALGIMSLHNENHYLAQLDGASYFKDVKLDPSAQKILQGEKSSINHIFINSDGNPVVFHGSYETVINKKTGEVLSKKKISQSGALVADAGKRVFIADFNNSSLTIRDVSTDSEQSVDINNFFVFENDSKISSSPHEFDDFLSKTTHQQTFITEHKMIGIYEEDGSRSAFIIDFKSGNAHYIKHFNKKVNKLVSVDNDGNIYGLDFSDDKKVIKILKFMADSKTPNKPVSKTTVKIDDNIFGDNNVFLDATVDSSGNFIIAAQGHGGSYNDKAFGFYLYSLDGGEIFHKNSILIHEDNGKKYQPETVTSYGQNQLLFSLSKNGHAEPPFYFYIAELDTGEGLIEEINKLNTQIQDAKNRLIEIESKVRDLDASHVWSTNRHAFNEYE